VMEGCGQHTYIPIHSHVCRIGNLGGPDTHAHLFSAVNISFHQITSYPGHFWADIYVWHPQNLMTPSSFPFSLPKQALPSLKFKLHLFWQFPGIHFTTWNIQFLIPERSVQVQKYLLTIIPSRVATPRHQGYRISTTGCQDSFQEDYLGRGPTTRHHPLAHRQQSIIAARSLAITALHTPSRRLLSL